MSRVKKSALFVLSLVLFALFFMNFALDTMGAIDIVKKNIKEVFKMSKMTRSECASLLSSVFHDLHLESNRRYCLEYLSTIVQQKFPSASPRDLAYQAGSLFVALFDLLQESKHTGYDRTEPNELRSEVANYIYKECKYYFTHGVFPL